MRRLRKVEIGQRFQSIGAITRAPASTYQVQSLFRSQIDQLEYARLAAIDDPTIIKSIGLSTLLNPRQFNAVC
jgi:hypothetical protein